MKQLRYFHVWEESGMTMSEVSTLDVIFSDLDIEDVCDYMRMAGVCRHDDSIIIGLYDNEFAVLGMIREANVDIDWVELPSELFARVALDLPAHIRVQIAQWYNLKPLY